jgi:hypothetical protein
MKKSILFDTSQWRYKRSRYIFSDSIIYWFREIGDTIPTTPPLEYIGKGRVKKPIPELGKSIFYGKDFPASLFETHVKRHAKYSRLSGTVYFVFSFLLMAIATAFLFILVTLLFPQDTDRTAFFSTLFYILIVPMTILANRISTFTVTKHFADTLVIIHGVNLLITLDQEKELTNPESRRQILVSLRRLKRSVQLIPKTFFTGAYDVDIMQHRVFHQMSKFIEEREFSVITPTEKTLDSLRKDFSNFVSIMITGQYGRFRFRKEKPSKPEVIRPAGVINNTFRLVATLAPFILLMSIFVFPSYYIQIGIDSNWVLLASLIWILLILDTYLKLGIIERATGILKTMKDLN